MKRWRATRGVREKYKDVRVMERARQAESARAREKMGVGSSPFQNSDNWLITS